MAEKDGMTNCVITQESVKRLARDVRQLRKSPLTSNGIYYQHDEENMLKGYAMIVGPRDTVYANGFYFFEFDYPTDYPSNPPKLTFRTNQNKIRFNPNLYTNGKVCISILNTWRGDQWSSCQTISSILLTLCTLFTNDPLLNEPGICRNHRDFDTYNRIVEYSNIDIAILNIVEKAPQIYLPWFDMFYDDVITHFKSHILQIANNIQNVIKKQKTVTSRNDCVWLMTGIYGMKIIPRYENIVNRFNDIFTRYATPEMLTTWKPLEVVCRTYKDKQFDIETEELLNELLGITPTNESIPSPPPTPKKPSTPTTMYMSSLPPPLSSKPKLKPKPTKLNVKLNSKNIG